MKTDHKGEHVYWTDARNFVYGCQPQGIECAKCWAAALIHRWEGQKSFGLLPGHLTGPDGHWTGALHITTPAAFTVRGRARVYAINWLGDLWYSKVPEEVTFGVIDKVIANIVARHHAGEQPHTYLFLSHRLARMAARVMVYFDLRAPSKDLQRLIDRSVWWGATIVRNIQAAHLSTDLDKLAELPGRRWLSIEPVLEVLEQLELDLVDWVTVGTSTNAPSLNMKMQTDAVDHVVKACKAAHVPVWVKQVGMPSRPVAGELRQMPTDVRAAFDA